MSYSTGGGGVSEFLGGWVSKPPPPSSPCWVGHCGGLRVSAFGAGQGILPMVVGWVSNTPPPPVGVGHLWVCGFAKNLWWVGPSNPPPPPPGGQENPWS